MNLAENKYKNLLKAGEWKKTDEQIEDFKKKKKKDNQHSTGMN